MFLASFAERRIETWQITCQSNKAFGVCTSCEKVIPPDSKQNNCHDTASKRNRGNTPYLNPIGYKHTIKIKSLSNYWIGFLFIGWGKRIRTFGMAESESYTISHKSNNISLLNKNFNLKLCDPSNSHSIIWIIFKNSIDIYY